MKNKLNIAIMAGGNSSEEEISLKRAKQISQWLDKNKFEVFPVIVKGISWTLKHSKGDFPISWDNFTAIVDGETLHFDCALIAIHGKPGETGTIFSDHFQTRYRHRFGLGRSMDIDELGQHVLDAVLLDQPLCIGWQHVHSLLVKNDA